MDGEVRRFHVSFLAFGRCGWWPRGSLTQCLTPQAEQPAGEGVQEPQFDEAVLRKVFPTEKAQADMSFSTRMHALTLRAGYCFGVAKNQFFKLIAAFVTPIFVDGHVRSFAEESFLGLVPEFQNRYKEPFPIQYIPEVSSEINGRIS